jgi:hypothetical protein
MGAAAWILEGISTSIQIWGKSITPGEATDLSDYRSELAGILAAMTVINSLACFHGISSSITIHCDCQTAIAKAFDSLTTIKLHDVSHDLLKATQHEKTSSQIRWSGKHIPGHQDAIIPFAQLDRLSQLNVLADQMAKEMIQTAIDSRQQ